MPRRYPLGTVLAYSARQLFMLLLVLPVALAGMFIWAVPFLSTRYVAPRFRPTLDQVATYKLGAALLAFPLWLAILVTGAWFVWGARLALGALVVLPVAGLAAIAWRDREVEVREDVRVFLRTRRLAHGRDRIAEQRARLVTEFDRLIEEWRGTAV